MNYKNILIFLLFSSFCFAQNINIIPQLKKIEAGELDEVLDDLEALKQTNDTHPDVIFLEAIITEDGEKSKNFYKLIYNNFPNSQFADAALFRNFSYFYALGLYKRAEEIKLRLQSEYPKSPYLKNTDREFPDVDEMLIVDSTPYKIGSQTEFKYTVQAGAFSNFNNAEDLKNKFITNGLTSKISPKNVNNIQLHIVTVGNFSTHSDADDFLIDLNRNYDLKGRVVKLH